MDGYGGHTTRKAPQVHRRQVLPQVPHRQVLPQVPRHQVLPQDPHRQVLQSRPVRNIGIRTTIAGHLYRRNLQVRSRTAVISVNQLQVVLPVL